MEVERNKRNPQQCNPNVAGLDSAEATSRNVEDYTWRGLVAGSVCVCGGGLSAHSEVSACWKADLSQPSLQTSSDSKMTVAKRLLLWDSCLGRVCSSVYQSSRQAESQEPAADSVLNRYTSWAFSSASHAFLGPSKEVKRTGVCIVGTHVRHALFSWKPLAAQPPLPCTSPDLHPCASQTLVPIRRWRD